ncbi:hypothetical protein RVIR1_13240 [Candidatus Rickettsiella viridis]|uniref:Uncharacterized protein n=1 Tax=Candidatus Rickettsiella viridis TaxID=676208 RepID=A0A2Z5UXB3_9COXI|nr:hypothetical protein [Candidatus Rickettsiella viridis]BBB15771.1 hypothetical protein RVIR1_13240 [Candidatus Rickettsiella viridis]
MEQWLVDPKAHATAYKAYEMINASFIKNEEILEARRQEKPRLLEKLKELFIKNKWYSAKTGSDVKHLRYIQEHNKNYKQIKERAKSYSTLSLLKAH